MKNQLWIIFVFILYCNTSASFIQDSRYTGLSVEEFTREIEANSDGNIQSEMIRGALYSGRADLINACYDYSAVRGYVDNEIIKMPDSPKKDAILMMLLRSRHSRWPDPARVHFGSRGIVQAIREPYTSFFKKYLPDISLDESLVATPEARLEFADRLEAAMTGKPLPPKKAPSQFPPVSQKESHPPPPPDKAGAGIDKVGTGNSPAASGTKLFVPALWLIAAIALGAISLAWWLLKKQK